MPVLSEVDRVRSAVADPERERRLAWMRRFSVLEISKRHADVAADSGAELTRGLNGVPELGHLA